MNGVVTVPARSADFQRAFVALRYYFGARGELLEQAFGTTSIEPAAADLLRDLAAETRDARARALGAELARLAAALEQRSLAR